MLADAYGRLPIALRVALPILGGVLVGELLSRLWPWGQLVAALGVVLLLGWLAFDLRRDLRAQRARLEAVLRKIDREIARIEDDEL